MQMPLISEDFILPRFQGLKGSLTNDGVLMSKLN